MTENIKQITDYIIQVGDKFFYESDEEGYYHPMEDITFDEWGVPQDYTLGISERIKNE